jgi:hypothetical protein
MRAKPQVYRLLGILPMALAGALPGWVSANAASASTPFPQLLSVRSQSGQFIINAPRIQTPNRNASANVQTNPAWVELDPTFLTVSCERVKQVLYRELGASAVFHDKVYLVLHSRGAAAEAPRLTAERFRDGWQYQVDLPREIERSQYMRTMVTVLLLEMANRTAGQRSAELPAWLVDGFAEQLLASNELELILPPPPTNQTSIRFAATNVRMRRENPLQAAHQVLCAGVPLTFDQLSWPGNNGPARQDRIYLASAQLFVNELSRLKEGKDCLREMLAQLPQHYNWQFAFSRGFRRSFASTLEVEKWWALRVLNFTGRDLAQIWPLEQSWEKLNAIVHASVQVRLSTNELPLVAEVALQRVIQEWDRERQVPTLRQKVGELKLLRQRVPDELLELVDGYRIAIETYLEDLEKKRVTFFNKGAREKLRQQTLTRLKQLDEELLRVLVERKSQEAVQARK